LEEDKEVVNAEIVEFKPGSNLPQVELANAMVECVRKVEIMKPEHSQFLVEHKKHLQTVMEKTFIWRTRQQKQGILSDQFFPTLHAKFHQSILEQKVQFEQAVHLSKDFEILKTEVEELNIDVEELQEKIDNLEKCNPGSYDFRRTQVKLRRKIIELQHKSYAAAQMKIYMEYRMREVMDWQMLQEFLIEEMHKEGVTDEQIWDKEAGEIESQFFLFLGNIQGVYKSTDSAEVNNLVGLAKHGVEQAKAFGMYEALLKRCNPNQLQALIALGLETKESLKGRVNI
jgi:hypothetical protein